MTEANIRNVCCLQLMGVPFSKALLPQPSGKTQKLNHLGSLGPATPAEQAHASHPDSLDSQTAEASRKIDVESPAEEEDDAFGPQTRLVIDRLSGLGQFNAGSTGISLPALLHDCEVD